MSERRRPRERSRKEQTHVLRSGWTEGAPGEPPGPGLFSLADSRSSVSDVEKCLEGMRGRGEAAGMVEGAAAAVAWPSLLGGKRGWGEWFEK